MSRYQTRKMNVHDSSTQCGILCCHDWSCESYEYHPDGGSVGGNCTAGNPCCVFRDDIDPLVEIDAGSNVITGTRTKLSSVSPPYPKSTAIPSAKVGSDYILGVNGDEFPITWAKDGNQYTGAGDNQQPGLPTSPASFFKVEGGPTEMGCVKTSPGSPSKDDEPKCSNVTLQGPPIPVQGDEVLKYCEPWTPHPVPNIKSSAVLSINGTLYWFVSCFNYGDDMVFNRQRYGPAWLMTSTDYGVTWNVTATPIDMFEGQLGAPRFVQYGMDYEGGPEDGWVYVYFPCTYSGAAFFENNDMILLGRVQMDRILDRSAYEFYYGTQSDGAVTWVPDHSIARPIWEFPMMTSVQQVNFHFGTKRYIFANWAWISYDGHPRPDHSPDEKNPRTGHQRTQLTLVEAPNPWGPFSVFYVDDDWKLADGSTGAYTPVIPPAWQGQSDFWIASTQCCTGQYFAKPLNHYNFILQHVQLEV
mmetsp:Transcript_24286/g.45446  ORF Transcript_24286/g.45446 Transcript_24286/m.45446 type:complete len:471 (-) Transcript_24286:170-1582(-)